MHRASERTKWSSLIEPLATRAILNRSDAPVTALPSASSPSGYEPMSWA